MRISSHFANPDALPISPLFAFRLEAGYQAGTKSTLLINPVDYQIFTKK